MVELASSAADAAESAVRPCFSTSQTDFYLAHLFPSSLFLVSASQDVVITVLPEPSHVKSVYASILEAATATSVNSQEEEPAPAPAPPPPPPPRGPGPRPGPRLFIDCSTIDPSSSRQVAASVAKAFQLPGEESQEGAAAAVFVDAPMSGGTVGAAAGTLTFMLGAPAALVPRVEPVLLRMGRAVVHCGPPGAGLAAKLANNYLLAVANVATAEAMNLGVRWGLDPAVLARVLNASTGRCWPSEVNNPVPGVVAAAPASRDYAGGFGLALMNKDLRLAMVAADEAGARLPLAGAARALYEAAEQDERCKGRDFSVVYRYIGGKE